MHLNWWEQNYKDILGTSTTPMNAARSGLSETYFSEEMGKLSETIKSIKCMLVEKLFTVHPLVKYGTINPVWEEGQLLRALPGRRHDRIEVKGINWGLVISLSTWMVLWRNVCSWEMLIWITSHHVFISIFQKQMPRQRG